MATEPGIRGLRGRWWQSGVYARKRPYLDARARITAAVRQVFAERGFLEVDTPALQVSPGLEPHLRGLRDRAARAASGDAAARCTCTPRPNSR